MSRLDQLTPLARFGLALLALISPERAASYLRSHAIG